MISAEEREKQDQADTKPERTLYDSGATGVPDLRFIHFNDVYHPHEGEVEPKGGAGRFKTMCDYYRHDAKFKDAPTPLTLFSGDAFNPSKESTVTKGGHMVPVLNNIGVDAAVIGNHEFDFGAAHFAYLAKDCAFPWLLANIFDPELGSHLPMGRCEQTKLVTTSNGLKVGLIGLVEKEWTEKIGSSLPGDLVYYDMKETAKDLAPKLREQGADIIVVMSHARQPRDFDFCENIPEGLVDLVLAGHDHWVEHKKFPNGTHLIRSGFDFKNLTYTEAFRAKDGKGWDFNIVRRNLVGDIPEDESMKRLGEALVFDVHRKLELPIGATATPLEARKDKCQYQESNYGNFLADLMRLYHDADCAIINGGTFLGDRIYPPGDLLLKDIVDCFPFEDPIVVVRVTGQALKDALENGVSKYPEKDPRFPQVGNIFFTFDPKAPVGDRIKSVTLGDEKLDLNKKYTVATRSHMANGKIGFESLMGESEGGTAEEVIDDENGILVSALLRQYFTSVQVVGVFKHLTGNHKGHWESILDGLGRHSARYTNDDEKATMLKKKVLRKWKRVAGKAVNDDEAMLDGDGDFFAGWTKAVAPMIEGRIQVVGA